MNVFFRKTVLLIFTMVFILCVPARSQDEYRAEIGVQGGGNIYAGDVNTIARLDYFVQNMKNIQPDFGAFFRYRFNPRTALRLGYDYSSVNGLYKFSETTSQMLSQQLHILDFTGEYNFFDLENDPYKRYSKKFSPYIFAGLGVMLMPNTMNIYNKKYSAIFPFGIGLKVKIAQRWNFNLQWANNLLLGDNLEGLLMMYDSNIDSWKSRINPMNNDLLSGINMGISFDFWKKGCNCNANIRKSIKSNKSLKQQ